MQSNNNSCWQVVLSNFLTKNIKVKNHINTPKTKSIFITIRTLAAVVFSALTLFSVSANAASITAEMSPEVKAAYEKSLAAQSWPEIHTKLAFMDNPYKKFDRALKKSLRKEAPEGKKRRLRTPEENTLVAKKMRFDYCQAAITFFVDFSQRAYDLTIVEDNPLTEDQLMAGNGIAYPFTDAEKNDGKTRPTQLALQLGWEYKGKGKVYAEHFLASCLAEPISLYYQEDK